MFRILTLVGILSLSSSLLAGEWLIKVESSADLTGLQSHSPFIKAVKKPFTVFTDLAVVEMEDLIPLHQKKELLSLPGVLLAEPNYEVSLLDFFPSEDPLYKEQWALENDGRNGGKAGADIKAKAAWQLAEHHRDVVVAVIDTGIDYRHPDLRDAMWTNSKEIPGNGIDDDNNGYIDDYHGYNFYEEGVHDPMDDHMHGTHCSGIIAASHNQIGIKGIAPKTKLMAVKFLGPLGNGDIAGGIAGIEYALKMKVDIMSNSWGGPPYSEILNEVMNRVEQAGILFVAAAGNDHANNDADPMYPASYRQENVIAVAASNRSDDIARFSNWGVKLVHLAAPGKDIYSTILNGRYKSASGTSMAAPYVSGVLSLMKSHLPNLSAKELKDRLLGAAEHTYIFEEKTLSGGRLDAHAALKGEVATSLPPDQSWEEDYVNVSSPSPYPNMARLKFSVSKPGAKAIRLHFELFETEKRVDFLAIKDGSGKLIESLHGKQGTLWSRVIPGDTADLTLLTDSINTFSGFRINKIRYQMD